MTRLKFLSYLYHLQFNAFAKGWMEFRIIQNLLSKLYLISLVEEDRELIK